MYGKILVLFLILFGFLSLSCAQTESGNQNGNEGLNNGAYEKDAITRQSQSDPARTRNSRTLYNVVVRPSIAPNQGGYPLHYGRGNQFPVQYGRPEDFGFSNFPFTDFNDPFFSDDGYQHRFLGFQQQPGYNVIPYYNQYPYNDVRLYRPGLNGYHGSLKPNSVRPPYPQDNIAGGYPTLQPQGHIDGLVRPPNGITRGIALNPNGFTTNGIALQPNGIAGRYPNSVVLQQDGVALQSSAGNGNRVQTNTGGISDYVDRDANGVPYLVHPSVRGRYPYQNQEGYVAQGGQIPVNNQPPRNGYYVNNDQRNGRPLPFGHSFLTPPYVRRVNSDGRLSTNRDPYLPRQDELNNGQYLESVSSNVEVRDSPLPIHPLPYAIVGDMNLDRRPNGDGYTTPVVFKPRRSQRLNSGQPRRLLRMKNRAYSRTGDYQRQ